MAIVTQHMSCGSGATGQVSLTSSTTSHLELLTPKNKNSQKGNWEDQIYVGAGEVRIYTGLNKKNRSMTHLDIQ